MKENLIYALVDSRNDLVVYVGKTTVGKGRPIQHTHYSHNDKVREWVAELKNNSLSPIVRIIENNIQLNDLSAREKYWIKYYYEINPDIFNYQLLIGLNVIHEYKIEEKTINDSISLLLDLPKLCKSIRYVYRINQTELAKYLGICRSTLVEIESGKDARMSNVLAILKLSASLNNKEPVDIEIGKRVRTY